MAASEGMIRQAIDLIAQGDHLRRAAEQVGIGERCLGNALQQPRYERALREARAAYRYGRVDVYYRKLEELAGTIDGVEPAGKVCDQINALRMLLGMNGHSLEQTVAEARSAAESKRWEAVEEKRRQIGGGAAGYAVPTLHTILHIDRATGQVIEHEKEPQKPVV